MLLLLQGVLLLVFGVGAEKCVVQLRRLDGAIGRLITIIFKEVLGVTVGIPILALIIRQVHVGHPGMPATVKEQFRIQTSAILLLLTCCLAAQLLLFLRVVLRRGLLGLVIIY